MTKRLCLIGLLGLLLIGCGKQAPQIPTQRKSAPPQVDSTVIAMLELNQHLAAAADEQMRLLARAQEEPYALYEANAWMTIIRKGDETQPAPAYNEEWMLHMKIYSVDGALLLDSQGSFRIGKQELPEAVDKNIGELHPGGKARIYAPWYSAYGVTGTNQIPPYENVIIEIDVL